MNRKAPTHAIPKSIKTSVNTSPVIGIVIPAHHPSTISMTVVANSTIVPTRSINALIASVTSSWLKKKHNEGYDVNDGR